MQRLEHRLHRAAAQVRGESRSNAQLPKLLGVEQSVLWKRDAGDGATEVWTLLVCEAKAK